MAWFGQRVLKRGCVATALMILLQNSAGLYVGSRPARFEIQP